MTPGPQTRQRQEWISLLGTADPAWLNARKEALGSDLESNGLAPDDLEPDYMVPPETGMVMMQARQDGAGPRFNLGEVTVTRCILKIGGIMGYAMVMGPDLRHAELAALFDALFQMPEAGPILQKTLIPRMRRMKEERRTREAAEVKTSKVEFFTLKRGE